MYWFICEFHFISRVFVRISCVYRFSILYLVSVLYYSQKYFIYMGSQVHVNGIYAFIIFANELVLLMFIWYKIFTLQVLYVYNCLVLYIIFIFYVFSYLYLIVLFWFVFSLLFFYVIYLFYLTFSNFAVSKYFTCSPSLIVFTQ